MSNFFNRSSTIQCLEVVLHSFSPEKLAGRAYDTDANIFFWMHDISININRFWQSHQNIKCFKYHSGVLNKTDVEIDDDQVYTYIFQYRTHGAHVKSF